MLGWIKMINHVYLFLIIYSIFSESCQIMKVKSFLNHVSCLYFSVYLFFWVCSWSLSPTLLINPDQSSFTLYLVKNCGVLGLIAPLLFSLLFYKIKTLSMHLILYSFTLKVVICIIFSYKISKFYFFNLNVYYILYTLFCHRKTSDYQGKTTRKMKIFPKI